MAENKVSVEITVEQRAALRALSDLGKEINKTEGEFGGLGKSSEEAFGVMGEAISGASSGFKSLVAGVTVANLASQAIVGTANAIKDFAFDSINAAIEAEDSTNRLAQALRSTGSYTKQAIEDFQNYASAMAQSTIYSDDQILSNIALAKTFGATNQQAKNLVMAASELAATYGGSLDQRVEQLGKTFTGVGGKLGTLIPGFKDLTEAQLKSGSAIDFVNSRLSGAAAAQLDTYGGKLGQLKKSFGELQESLGGFVVQSGISGVFDKLATAINNVTQRIEDSKIASDRSKIGFKETEGSVEQLARKYASLTDEISIQQAIIDKANNGPKFLINPGDISFAQSKIKSLSSELSTIYSQIEKASSTVASSTPDSSGRTPSGGAISKTDQALIDSRNAAYAQIEISRATFNQQEIEQSVAKQQITEENYAFELQRLQDAEAMKIEAIYAAEEVKANAIKDSKLAQFAIEKAQIDKEMALQKSRVETKKKIDNQQVALEQQKQAAMAGAALAGLNLLGSIAKDGSREQFLIQKAAAIGSAAIAAKVAYMQALAFPPGPPATIPTASWVAAAGVANIAAIVATSLKGFEQGGIIAGTSMTGDNIGVRVNSGEMILNRQQQTELFKMANGAGSGDSSIADELRGLKNAIMSQSINLMVDGRAIATVVRKEVQSGFRLA